MYRTFKLRLALILLIFSTNIFAASSFAEKVTLTGNVKDKMTQENLIGVSVFISDLKTGGITDLDGNFKIDNLPSRTVTIQISLVGYKTLIQTINLMVVKNVTIELDASVKEINAVVITGSPNVVEKNRTPTPITVVPKNVIEQSASTNIIDALTSQPGISQITTGSGISKPVIRGLGYNRVVVVNDGVRQEGQQWGDEHGIEIDEYNVDNVEILKGPASLTFGSDAMAGVINFISSPSLPNGKVNGEVLSEYQSNNGLYGFSANTKGNKNGFIWDARLSTKSAHSYQNKYDGYVYNSGFKEYAGLLTIGLNRQWGYSHLTVSNYFIQPGITEGDRDSASGKFVKKVPTSDSTFTEEIVSDQMNKSYSIQNPFQKINHLKIIWSNSLIIKNGSLKSIFGFQQNTRKEYADIFNPNQFGLFFDLKTFNYELKYHFPEMNKYNLTAGINGMIQNSLNKGSEFLVPAYNLLDGGIFTLASKNFQKLDVSAGIRYDFRNVNGNDLYLDSSNRPTNYNNSAEHKFSGFNTLFNGFTGSAGVAYNFNSTYYTKANISFGFRAPNIAELGANGIHEGTLRYEKGNSALKAEHSQQMDVAIGINTDHLTIELDGFINSINNFIFLSKLSTANGNDSITDGYSTFQYVSGNARLAGGELMIDLHPHPFDWLHFENSFSFVDAQQINQSDSTKYLPSTPPAKFTSEIQLSVKKLSKLIRNSYFKIGADIFFDQNKIYSAYHTETATSGYQLLHTGIGTDLFSKNKKVCSIFLNVTNLGDIAYQSHLSRLKYAPENLATGRNGIYNTGRSINFKVIVPLFN